MVFKRTACIYGIGTISDSSVPSAIFESILDETPEEKRDL